MSLIGILVALIIICVVFWACRAILAAFSIGEPISTVVQVLLVVLVLLWILGQVGGLGVPSLRLQ